MPLEGSDADGGARLVRMPGIGKPSPSQVLPGQVTAGRQTSARDEAGPPDAGARLSDGPTWLIAGAVFFVYILISGFRYLRRDPTSWDLGIFTEYVKQYSQLKAPIVDVRGAGFDLLGDHFHPIVAVLAPFFRVFPTPVTLLVAQALLAAASVLPVSRLARELLGDGTGRVIAVAYGLSWGLQQMVNYDFHEIAFAVPLLAFSMSEMVRGRMRAAAAWALPLVFVKEDQGFTLAAIGLIMVFTYRRRGLGLFLAGWGVLWSLLAILVIIPHFNQQHSYAYWSAGGGISPVGGHFSLGGLWTELSTGASTKLSTLALILLPTGFLALGSPLALAAVPSLALRFVGTNPAYWGTQWHYNATVMPIVFIAAIDAMARIRVKRALAAERGEDGRPGRLALAMEHYGAAAMLAVSAGLAFQFPLSYLWTPSTYALSPHVMAENRAMTLVPSGATVATDLDLLAPLAARTDTFWLGNYQTNPSTQYVVFDNESTDWSPQPDVLQFVQTIIPHTRYRQIFADNNVYVFQRIG